MIFNKMPKVEIRDSCDQEVINCQLKENQIDTMRRNIQLQLEKELAKLQDDDDK